MIDLKNILLNGVRCKSAWFMRQAGRYLPEFREIRSKNPNFIKLCLNSELSSNITLQPINRFDLDSAIIFSDILTVPYALGQNISFTKQDGPELSKLDINIFYKNNKTDFSKKLEPVYKAIKITRQKLDKKKSLISFIGAPWTLLVYMFNLKKKNKEIDISKFKNQTLKLNKIIDELTEYLYPYKKSNRCRSRRRSNF